MGRPIFATAQATLRSAGRVAPDAGWRMPGHAHPYWEFIYFLRGCGRVELPAHTLRPHLFHLVIYPPGLPHAEATDPIDPEETLFIGVQVSGTPPQGAHLLLPDLDGDLRWLMEHIVREYGHAGDSPLAQTYVRAFLLQVERVWGNRLPVAHDAVDLCAQYLHEHYAQPLTLPELAAVCRVSETTLTHRFAARMGAGPMRYLQQIRLDCARRLLLTTALPISEVARQVGFSDPLYFSRAFRQAMAVSPSAFRRRYAAAEKSMPVTE